MRKQIMNRITTLFLVCAIITFGIYTYTGMTGNANVGGYRVFHIASASMEPVIMTGDFVLTKIVRAEDVRTGDIVVYNLDGIHVIHRIVERTEEGFIFKGDNNAVIDPEIVSEEQIQYIVVKDFNRKL